MKMNSAETTLIYKCVCTRIAMIEETISKKGKQTNYPELLKLFELRDKIKGTVKT